MPLFPLPALDGGIGRWAQMFQERTSDSMLINDMIPVAQYGFVWRLGLSNLSGHTEGTLSIPAGQ